MELPARLRETTLGDLLATLHRAYACGVLELIEPGRRHAIHLRRGLVQAVERSDAAYRFGDLAADAGLVPRDAVDHAARDPRLGDLRIGQRLVARGALTHTARDRVLAAQRARRLDTLYELADAELRFHAAQPLPPGSAECTPMDARETFFGRARHRDHGHRRYAVPGPERTRALHTLGLPLHATPDEIRQRYRARVAALHPDHAHGADDTTRRLRESELRAVIDAYRTLVC